MNLHSIAGPIVGAVNPPVIAQYQASSGYTTTGAGRRAGTYADATPVQAQMQALTAKEIDQVNGLNIQGEKRALYLTGGWMGLARPDWRGGDLFTMPDASVWLVVLVLENWSSTSGWAKVAVTRQSAP